MKKISEYFVIASGLVVLASILTIFYAIAYLKSGHPPASGIVALVIILTVSPLSFVASIIGAIFHYNDTGIKCKIIYIMTGINMTFTFIVLCVFVFKVLLGKAI